MAVETAEVDCSLNGGGYCQTVCIGYTDLTLPILLTAPAVMLTVSGRDYVDRPTHEFGAELDCRVFP